MATDGTDRERGRRARDDLVLLGRFALVRHGIPVVLGAPAQRVLARVALHGGAIARRSLAAQLWPDTHEEKGAGSLRVALHQLRRRAPGVLDVDRTEVALAPHVRVDVREAAQDVARVLGRASLRRTAVGRVSARLRADLLPGWYDEWLMPEVAWWDLLRSEALDALLPSLLAAGLRSEATRVAVSLGTLDPSRGGARAILATLRGRAGNLPGPGPQQR